jgi:glucokinase
MRNYLGIEIGGTKLQLVVGTDDALIRERFRFVVDPEEGADGIKKQIKSTLKKIRLHAVAAIGIGFGGPVDHASGTIFTSHQIPGWGNFSIQEWLEGIAGIPVWIENDANVAAFGEAFHGAGKEYDKVFYVTMGSGVGAGLVVNKSIYHGAAKGEAEFGHIRLDKNGKTIESTCSGWAVDERIRSYVSTHPHSVLGRLTKDYARGEARVLSTALQANDSASIGILEETVDDFAFGLSHAVHLLNPETIILGGGLSLIGETFRQMVELKVPKYLMNVFRPGPIIQLSALKEDAVPVGALTLAISKLHSA